MRDLCDDVRDLARGRSVRPVDPEGDDSPADLALEYDCPSCGAAPGMDCVTAGRGARGHPRTPHASRAVRARI